MFLHILLYLHLSVLRLLAPEDDMSGITIFGDEMEETTREEIESEDGEILEKANPPEPRLKMTVEFPGINAPLPENADVWLWEAAAPSHRSSRGNNRWQQRTSRGHDYRDDDQLGFESSSYPPRYGSRNDYGYGSKDRRSRSRSPIIERSLTERSKRDYSYDPDFRDRDRNRDRHREWDRDRERDWDRDDRNRDWDRDRDRDRDWDRDDRDWSYRFRSRR